MKTSIYYIMLWGMLGYWAQGQYYEITTDIYTPGLTLNTGDSLYMTDGGFDSLALFGNSTAIIEGTLPLEAGSGGIWFLAASNTSHLEISGGDINHLDMNGNAIAILSGGTILEIASSQQTRQWDNDNGVWIQTPHISIRCLTHDYDDMTGLLTGYWQDGSAFNIQLIDIEGYNPAIDNILFIPEPAGWILLALGGVFGRKRVPKTGYSRKFPKKA